MVSSTGFNSFSFDQRSDIIWAKYAGLGWGTPREGGWFQLHRKKCMNSLKRNMFAPEKCCQAFPFGSRPTFYGLYYIVSRRVDLWYYLEHKWRPSTWPRWFKPWPYLILEFGMVTSNLLNGVPFHHPKKVTSRTAWTTSKKPFTWGQISCLIPAENIRRTPGVRRWSFNIWPSFSWKEILDRYRICIYI